MSDSESKDDDKENDDEFEDYPPIIIDNGGGSMKCGFTSLTNDYPESVFSTIVGHSIINDASEYSSEYVGEQAVSKGTKKLSLTRPITSGVIKNWEDMTTIWQHIFEKELKCLEDVEDSTVVLSETPINPRFNREKTAQIMFETFNVASYYTQNTAVFELFSHGQTTGMVIGMGFDTCYTVPIYQGYALSHATNRMDIGCNTVNQQLRKLLNTSGFNLENIANKFEIVEEIKKKMCYVSTDYWQEMKNRDSLMWKNQNVIKYGLPDGREIILNSNRFESTEIFFKPSLIGGHHAMKHKSICEYAYDSLLSVNIDVRKEITSQICIAGGGTLLNGFVERIKKDIQNIVPHSWKESMKLKIHCKPNRYSSAYIGASILSTLDFFKEIVITNEEYAENGPKIVHRKCF